MSTSPRRKPLLATLLALCLWPVAAFGQSCETADMVADLAETNPAAHAALMVEAAGVPNTEAMLWKVEKEGIEPSYLFGTVHTNDPRVARITPTMQSAIEDSRIILNELAQSAEEAQVIMSRLMGKRLDLFMAEPGAGIGDVVSADEARALEGILADYGLPHMMVRNAQPWFVATMISIPPCAIAGLGAGGEILDDLLRSAFVAKGKETAGLETAEEQLAAISSISDEEQVLWLKGSIAAYDDLEPFFSTLLEAYNARQLGVIMPFSQRLVGTDLSGFSEVLIDNRNLDMFERSRPQVDEGGAFIAVGALHIIGDTGLVSLYRAAGYEVTPLE